MLRPLTSNNFVVETKSNFVEVFLKIVLFVINQHFLTFHSAF
jgi:hypothetical protein